MFSISLLKANGKEAFKKNYWICVLAAFILSVVSGSAAAASSSTSTVTSVTGSINEASIAPFNLAFLSFLLPLIGIGLIVGFLFATLITAPIEVGCRIFFLDNSFGNARLENVVWAFKKNYKNTVITMFLTNLFIIIGFMLFVIPGIILSYSLRMVPYLLADRTDLSATDIIKESMRLMRGYKFQAFLFDLSFIGWDILSAITLGLLGVFYVMPYKAASDAELYKAISQINS